jgi:hypothetical protein
MLLSKYSFGIGDRFAQQGEAQLRALMRTSAETGLEIVPVWNKSNREHIIVGSEPEGVRREAENAVAALGYSGQWFTDADHINMTNVDRFIESSDFFTIDVADFIGRRDAGEAIDDFVDRHSQLASDPALPGANGSTVSRRQLQGIAAEYLFAIREAARIYRHIEAVKGAGTFVAEVSMDEATASQRPVDFVFILREMAFEGIALQTIAPKFYGDFYKGVDYVGNVDLFARQFEEYMQALNFAVERFGLPANLKLSIHSGSDKFSLYPAIGQIARRYNRGFHIKTAGTTWLEEMTGLAISGDAAALRLAKQIYAESFERCDELCLPYITVININRSLLPSPSEVEKWTGLQFASALRHIPGNPEYNSNMRQLVHVAYKIAAEHIYEYLAAVRRNKDATGSQVEENLYERHLKRLFGAGESAAFGQ